MSECSDRPFAMGSMFGIRSFRVNEAGFLTGVVHQVPWAAGLNEAVCCNQLRSLTEVMRAGQPTMADFAWAMERFVAQANGRVCLTKRPKPPKPPERPSHTIASLDCTCGFYAYFDTGHNQHHVGANVLGIVEGFGVMTVGSRGFRASKARVRALILPPERPRPPLRLDYGVPVFDSVDAALAEFPLTVPEGTPEPVMPQGIVTSGNGYVIYTMRIDAGGAWQALRRAAEAADRAARRLQVTTDGIESPRDRALRLRRERNTGPDDQRGLDGRRRRG